LVEGMIDDIFGQDLLNSVSNTLSHDVFSDPMFADAIKTVQKISDDVIAPLAIMLVCMYFLINIVDKFSSDTFTWEQLGRLMVGFLIGIFLIENCFAILKLLFQLGDSLLAEISPGSGEGFDELANLAKDAYKAQQEDQNFIMDWIWDIIMIPIFIIPWLFSWLMRLAVKIICYSRLIEILIRTAFAPIALSDFFHHGLCHHIFPVCHRFCLFRQHVCA